MKVPKTTGQLRNSLANILTGVLNGDIKVNDARAALTAATRITESFQAESRMRQIALAAKETVIPMGEQLLSSKIDES
jgi:hypothetical protein